MKSLTPWRWNPVLGEYESGPREALQGTGEISAVQAFSDCTMLLMGGTGFVGKVFLAMILDRFPELRHLIVQVRRKKSLSGEQRFFSDILSSTPVRRTVEHLGGIDAVRMLERLSDGRTVAGTPNSRHTVLGSSEEKPAVTTELRRIHAHVMPENGTDRLSRRRIPQAQFTIDARREKPAAVCTEDHPAGLDSRQGV
jgi:hypothetical protein